MRKSSLLRPPLFSRQQPSNRAVERRITGRALQREADSELRDHFEREPDPRIEHVVTIEFRETYAARFRCECGIDHGWQSYLVATESARRHRDRVEQRKAEENVDDVPVPMIERRLTPSGGTEFRAYCGRHLDGGPGVWLPSEQVAIVLSIAHDDHCRPGRANASIHLEPGGNRV